MRVNRHTLSNLHATAQENKTGNSRIRSHMYIVSHNSICQDSNKASYLGISPHGYIMFKYTTIAYTHALRSMNPWHYIHEFRTLIKQGLRIFSAHCRITKCANHDL